MRHPARGLGWLAGRSFAVNDPADMLITIAAEDSFDAEPDLHRVSAPTLVGATSDPFYSEDLFKGDRHRNPPWARRALSPQRTTFTRQLQNSRQHRLGVSHRWM
jgi:hypothetical protein